MRGAQGTVAVYQPSLVINRPGAVVSRSQCDHVPDAYTFARLFALAIRGSLRSILACVLAVERADVDELGPGSLLCALVFSPTLFRAAHLWETRFIPFSDFWPGPLLVRWLTVAGQWVTVGFTGR